MRVLTANGDDLTDSGDPSRVMMRRDEPVLRRIREGAAGVQAQGGAGTQARRCRQVRGPQEPCRLRPDVVTLARRLRRKRPKGGQRSLRDVAAELAQRGHLNEQGRPFSAASVRSMLMHP